MQLTEYLSTTAQTDDAFARLVGVTPEAVRLWKRGKRTPRGERMAKIVAVTDGAVRPNDFFVEAAE